MGQGYDPSIDIPDVNTDAYKIIGRAVGTLGYNKVDIIIDGESDLVYVPTDFSPGSTVHTPGFTNMWELSIDGNWVSLFDDEPVAN